MAKKTDKKKDDVISEEEIVREGEAQGMLDHDEAEQILEEDKALEEGADMQPVETKGEQMSLPVGEDADVKRVKLQGRDGRKSKTDFEQPGTDNQSRVVEGEEETE